MNEDLQVELSDILTSLKSRILWSKEMGKPLPFDCRHTGKKQKETTQSEMSPHTTAVNFAGGQGDLAVVRQDLGDCRRCQLSCLRTKIVFGEGNPHARLVFVGEAPGADEDREGRPFVGRAGQLLTKIINAMGLARKDVYICNILKCRPPDNRNPETPEIAACEPFLLRQLAAISPLVICTLGTFAAQALLKQKAPITALRGRFYTYAGIKVMPTFHPAYLLRNPAAKKQVWEDVQLVMKELTLAGKPS